MFPLQVLNIIVSELQLFLLVQVHDKQFFANFSKTLDLCKFIFTNLRKIKDNCLKPDVR